MKRLAGNTILLIISTAISLVAAELVVRVTLPQSLSGSWRVESAKGGYLVNRDSGGSRHQFGDRIVQYQFGTHHLRVGPDRSEAQHKVLVLGDSFTFGWLLNWEDTYVGRLQLAADKALGSNKIEFLNAAAGGWGTADYVAFYEDYGNEVGAQTVLVFLNTDDIGRSVRSGIYAISGASEVLERQPPRHTSRLKSFMNSLPGYQYALEHSHLFQLMRVVALSQSRSELVREPGEFNASPVPRSVANTTRVDDSTRLAKALFLHLSRLARERQHKLIVLTTGWHKFGPDAPNEPTAAFMEIADQFFNENAIQFVDLSDEVYRRANGTTEDIIIKNDGHPNEQGALLISEVTWGVLSKLLTDLQDRRQ